MATLAFNELILEVIFFVDWFKYAHFGRLAAYGFTKFIKAFKAFNTT